MAATNELLTYGDVSIREDVVLNAIEYLTARENQVFNMLGKVTAISTIHSFLTDTLRTAASAAIAEDGDYTILSSSTPSRLTNLVEIVAIPFQVSRTQQQVAHYTGQNELERQTQKALWDWANSAEFDLIRGTLTSGVSGTAPTFAGMIVNSSLANNHTSQTSGTIFNTSILDSLMGNCWTNSNGDVADNLLLGQWLRQKMDQAIQKSNVVVNTPNGLETVIRTVSTYQTSFGTLSVRTHRYVQQAGDATGRLFAFRQDKNKVAFLQQGGKPFIDTEIARSGDYDRVLSSSSVMMSEKSSKFRETPLGTILSKAPLKILDNSAIMEECAETIMGTTESVALDVADYYLFPSFIIRKVENMVSMHIVNNAKEKLMLSMFLTIETK